MAVHRRTKAGWLAAAVLGLALAAAVPAAAEDDAGLLLRKAWERYEEAAVVRGWVHVTATVDGRETLSLDLTFVMDPRSRRFRVRENGLVEGKLADRYLVWDGENLWEHPSEAWIAFLLPPPDLPELANPVLAQFARLINASDRRTIVREFGRAVIEGRVDAGETLITATLLDDAVLPARIVEERKDSRTTFVFNDVTVGDAADQDQLRFHPRPGMEVFDGRKNGRPVSGVHVLGFPDAKQFLDFRNAITDAAVALQQSDWFHARPRAEEAAALLPESAIAQTILGGIHLNLGQLSEALAFYERALALQPLCAPAMFDKAIILYRFGRVEEALRLFEEVQAVAPESRLAGTARDLGDQIRSFLAVDESRPGPAWEAIFVDTFVKTTHVLPLPGFLLVTSLLSPEQALTNLISSTPERDLTLDQLRLLTTMFDRPAHVGRLSLSVVSGDLSKGGATDEEEESAAAFAKRLLAGARVRVDGRPLGWWGLAEEGDDPFGLVVSRHLAFFGGAPGRLVPVEIAIPDPSGAKPLTWTLTYPPVFHPRLSELVRRIERRLRDRNDQWEIEQTKLTAERGVPVLEGVVRNPGRATREVCRIEVKFLDGRGQVVSEGRAVVKNLAGGASSRFRVMGDRRAVAKNHELQLTESFDWPWFVDGRPDF